MMNFRMHMKKAGSNKGMGLVETIVYMSILVVLLGILVQSTLLLVTHYRAVRNTRDIEDSAISVLDRIIREARSADDIVVSSAYGSTTLNVSPGTLALISTDVATGQSTTTMFYVSNTKVRMSQNGIDIGPLTKESVSVLGFTLRQVTTARFKAIKVELSLQADEATPAVISKNFYSTVVVRGSY